MTEKERAFLDEIQAVCDRHKVTIKEHGYQTPDYFFESNDTDIYLLINEDLLDE